MKLHPFPQGQKPKRQLRRAPVKIGAKTLDFVRPVYRFWRWELVRVGSGRLRIRTIPRPRDRKRRY